jgi:hypothetical protein
MTQDMKDKDFVAPIIDVSNQSAFVVADIENNADSNVVRVPPTGFNISEVLPIR